MSEDSISIIITVGIIALMLASVLYLNVIYRVRRRPAEESHTERQQDEAWQQRASASSLSSLSSRRLADQSRDLLHALSTRGERANPRSQAGDPRVSTGSAEECGCPEE